MSIFHRQTVGILLFTLSIGGCVNAPIKNTSTPTPSIDVSTAILPKNSPIAIQALFTSSPTPELTGYEFPDIIHPESQYLFYLHGKILEDQSLPAVSPDYGVYEYEAILSKLASYGFVVISEQRPKNADANVYARKTIAQVNLLLEANVPPENITVVGASKGAYIAATVSSLLKNEEVNFLLLGSCYPEMVEDWKQNQMYLCGNILSIYDSIDEYAGSCEELFAFSEGKGIARHDELVLHLGMGHGILYLPMDEWIIPIVQFTSIDQPSQ